VNGDAGPFACDWEGDGAFDLLVGDGEGAVWFFRKAVQTQTAGSGGGDTVVVQRRLSGRQP